MQQSVTTAQILAKLPSRFQPAQAKDLAAIYQFNLSDGPAFYIEIQNQTCTIENGEHEDPNIVLGMQEDTFIGLMSGEIDGMSAFLKGQLSAHGNVMLATSLGKLFKRKASDAKKIKKDSQ